MFNRYNISNTEDRREALIRTEAHLANVPAEPDVAPFRDTDRKRTVERKTG